MAAILTQVRYETGMTFEQFVERSSKYGNLYREIYEEIKISSEDLRRFADLVKRHDGRVNVLVLTEEWCGDSQQNLPIVARIVASTPGMELRIFQSESAENQDLTKRWPKGDRNPIPIVVFLDKNFNEIGNWIERSRAADALVAELFEELRAQIREAYRRSIRQETLAELAAALSGERLV